MQLPTPKITFRALPGTPHLTYSICGYSLLSLQGFPEEITSDQIDKITVNGTAQQFRPMGNDTVMLIPGIPKLEAQAVHVFCKEPAEAPGEAFRAWRQMQARQTHVVQPETSYGFTAPSNPIHGGH